MAYSARILLCKKTQLAPLRWVAYAWRITRVNSGIYLITNTINGKEYAGKSKRLQRRKYLHFYDLKRGRHDNPHLQRAYDHYGRDTLVFLVVEYCEPEDLVCREKWWIDILDLKNPEKGYNITDPQQGRTGIRNSAETRAKISAANKG